MSLALIDTIMQAFPKGAYNEYYHSIWGQLEFAFLSLMLGTCAATQDLVESLNITDHDLNDIRLYLTHWAYSPFVDHIMHPHLPKLVLPTKL
jgi:hypothetical protein